MEKHTFETPDINMVEALAAQLLTVNRRLEESNRQLKESEEARMLMLSNISHDLRAPLTAIRGALDRLLEGGITEEAERLSMISVIDRRVSALEHLVGELYYSVSLDQPGFSLHLDKISLIPFLEEWFITHQYSSDGSQRDFNLDLPGNLEIFVCIDPERIVRVLDNLMQNALKFTKPGDVIILSVRSDTEPDSLDSVEIILRDTGCGISPDDLSHIFERTYTASHSRTPSERPGIGLGLSIAWNIVEKHGGVIRCESDYGKGSAFFIQLPLTRRDP